MNSLEIRNLKNSEIDKFIKDMENIPWDRDFNIYKKYLLEQDKKIRDFLIVKHNDIFVGHVSLIWESKYHFFNQKNIPEISDLLVLKDYQRQGIGERLISSCEKKANNSGYRCIGLGVGLYEDYKPACKLYNKLNYKLDGQGVYSNYKKVIPGETVIIDDDLVIWLVKEL